VNECFEYAHQRVLVVSKDPHGDLTGFPVDTCESRRKERSVSERKKERSRVELTFDSSDSEAVDLIRGETERNSFLDVEGPSLKRKREAGSAKATDKGRERPEGEERESERTFSNRQLRST